MKSGMCVTILLLAGVGAARAQIDFRCRLINSKVLQYESIPVEVIIANNTGRLLALGGDGSDVRLFFDIETTPGALVMPTGVPLLTNRVVIKPADTARLVVDLLPSYAIPGTGPCSITGRLEWRDLVFVSAKMYVDIVPGLEIARLAAGIPELPQSTRTYSLRTLNRDRGERVFLRITDEAGRSYGVLDLGRIVRVYKPVMHVDEEGNLQIVHQNGPGSYVRHVITPYGRVVAQEAYTGDSGNLRLKGPAVSGPVQAPAEADADSVRGEAVGFEQLGMDSLPVR